MERRRTGAGIGLLIVLGLALGARGCGPVDEGGTDVDQGQPTAKTTAVTGEDRGTVAGQALGSIGGFSVGLFQRSLIGGDLRACAKVTGDVQDSDEDGIPNDATLRFDGCFAETGFGIGAVTGFAELRDVNRGSRDGLFDGELDLRIEALETEPFDWSSATTRVQGTLRGLGREGDGAAIAHFLHIRIDLEREGKSHTVESDTRWRVAYDPIGTWRPGDQPGPGNYWIEGRWRLDVDGEREIARIETRDALARREPSCPFPCDHGALAADLGIGLDDHDPTIVFIWTGCNAGFVRVVEDDDWDDDWDWDWDDDDWDHHGDDDDDWDHDHDWDHHGDDDDDWDHDHDWDHHGDDDDDWDHGDDDDDGWDHGDDDDGWDHGDDDDDGWDGDDDDGSGGGDDDDDDWDGDDDDDGPGGGDDDDDAGSPGPTPTSTPTGAPTGAPTSTPVSTPEEPEETPTSTPVSTPGEPEETPTSTPVSTPGEPEEMPTSSPISTPEEMPVEVP